MCLYYVRVEKYNTINVLINDYAHIHISDLDGNFSNFKRGRNSEIWGRNHILIEVSGHIQILDLAESERENPSSRKIEIERIIPQNTGCRFTRVGLCTEFPVQCSLEDFSPFHWWSELSCKVSISSPLLVSVQSLILNLNLCMITLIVYWMRFSIINS